MAKKMLETCMFCDVSPCECNGPVEKKKPVRKRTPKPKADTPVSDNSSPPTPAQDTSVKFIRNKGNEYTQDEEDAIKALAFAGLLHPDERNKFEKVIKVNPKGELLKWA